LHPNAWELIVYFECLCKFEGMPCLKNVFHCLFGPWQQKINEGYSNLALKGVKYMKSFVTSEESFKGFKDKYVFLRPTKNVWNDLFEVEPSGENKYRSWFIGVISIILRRPRLM